MSDPTPALEVSIEGLRPDRLRHCHAVIRYAAENLTRWASEPSPQANEATNRARVKGLSECLYAFLGKMRP